MSNGPKRVYPPVYFVLAILVMIGVHRFVPVKQLLASPLRYWGAVLMAAGVGLVLWVEVLFRRAGTTIKPFQESSALVIEGPFRVSRNPIYLGMVALLTGLALVLGSLTPFLVIPAFMLVIDRRFVRPEEAMLTQTFGAQYEAYKTSVRRWL